MKFLRNFLASILGSLFAFGILFVMFLIFVSLVSSSEDAVAVKDNSILELQLQRPISDYTGSNELDPFAGIFEESQGLDEIIHAIEVAKNDDRIKGISINNNFIIAGLAQTQAIRRSLEDFKAEGKFIYAYADFFMQRDYYLASVADSVFINPVGVLDFKGLSTEVLYYKELQEKSGVKMEVIRHGKYKSAVEPYLENNMSEANRSQLTALLQSLWNSMVTDISETRSISESDLNVIADTLGGRTPNFAKLSGLVDDVVFYDQYENKLANALELKKDDKINYSSLDDYVKYSNKKTLKSGDDKIAVVFAQGEIFYGEGGPNIIGQGIINEALIKAREDDKVKAIVLRVNSPGGSALTSDIIWREVELAKKVKPVIVSMGNVAASGGYYIAAGANKIFAEPTTITGSIGVFGTVPNLTELADNVGINAEQVGTNKNAVEYSLFEPMQESFKNQVQESIEETYETFLQRVSQGRGMTMAQVDSVAQGRVWSGTEALEIGLVDELGNLDDAISAAAEMAEIDTYGVKKFPKYKSGFERFMEDLEGASVKIKENLLKDEIGEEAYQVLKELQSFKKQSGVQARMPFALDIK
ncbi:MAG TPA: signal peptide peptidase SppA [Maribacter sp.]|uniref:signal peptide peptidase SppA n=2 Tax=Flavobacteriaceae TaxID=49546 RepID=UPI0007198F4B|nr:MULTISPECIES: signal peptide peptidase SppA [Maribacter]KSA15019.1 Protease IV [Maribacter dokdonensis DSW-8]HAF75944.1 signal peptide peptidase SppA [Maribacter sp.]HAI36966.1 signal peptide peptidase SppA [Maribacter sp.]|tara:strand:+ start:158709 stop:160469 length:1761 start_codon:yes stop_codon:yes gene_type:complete